MFDYLYKNCSGILQRTGSRFVLWFWDQIKPLCKKKCPILVNSCLIAVILWNVGLNRTLWIPLKKIINFRQVLIKFPHPFSNVCRIELPVDFPKAKKWAPRVTNRPKASFPQLTFNVLTRATKLGSVLSCEKKFFGNMMITLEKQKKKEKCAIQEFKTRTSLKVMFANLYKAVRERQKNCFTPTDAHQKFTK